jgi:aryl-alcohol dehydrogenase-like predicted oxidoreductase
LQRAGVMSVIVGAKTIEQLNDNLAAAKVVLTIDEIAALDKASAPQAEYPGWMLERQGGQRLPTPVG